MRGGPQPPRGRGQGRNGNENGRGRGAPGRGIGNAEARQPALVYPARHRDKTNKQFQYLPRHIIKLITLKRLAGLDALAIIEERFGRGLSLYHKKPAPYQIAIRNHVSLTLESTVPRPVPKLRVAGGRRAAENYGGKPFKDHGHYNSNGTKTTVRHSQQRVAMDIHAYVSMCAFCICKTLSLIEDNVLLVKI
ncbi:uncharacterized protein LOC128282114 [Gossypium arboreum]|uniref:uncharacterized protein LOC128282114 n=1 Tax=Gossypium arboreum TaxID=29729 RepID=UPI0022F180EE|nr:uncharacterized protein LOC128282114 [Gossypium arboreum]